MIKGTDPFRNLFQGTFSATFEMVRIMRDHIRKSFIFISMLVILCSFILTTEVWPGSTCKFVVDGTMDDRNTYTYTYDSSGNLTHKVKENDYRADGTVNSRSTYIYTYDNSGNLTQVVEEN